MAAKYDFGGVATSYGIKCADGKTIMRGAFVGCDNTKVPLVWNHQHGNVDHVLGHAILKDRGDDVYAYCKFNDTPSGRKARKILENGDIDALSIYANNLDKQGSMVRHGVIREVSMVLCGANPGALIDSRSIAHSMGYEMSDPDIDEILDSIDEAQIYHGMGDAIDFFDGTEQEDEDVQHSEDDQNEGEQGESEGAEDLQHAEGEDADKKEGANPKAVWNSMNKDQQTLAIAMVAEAMASEGGEDDEEKPMEHSDINEGGEEMKVNAFDNNGYVDSTPHLDLADRQQIIKDAKKMGSLKDAIQHHLEDPNGIIAHAYPYNHDEDGNPTTQQTYGIADINWLFPEARALTREPEWIKRDMDWVSKLMSGTKHTPFARVKSMFADITADEARAKGYIKGNRKIEEVFTLLKRTTDPQTIYKKQKLDRDDIVDITDFDVVAWIRGEMRMMLNEEIARAVLVGDGRLSSADDKISEDHIRSIYHEDDLFSIKCPVTIPNPATDDQKAKALIRAAKKARKDYKGSGNPIFFTTEENLANMLLLEDGQGYFMFKTEQELATVLRVREIVTVPVMEGLTRTYRPEGASADVTAELAAIIVNPADYNIGADRGGEINNFEDFDIDFNQHKYLIETRISGALVKPKSALVMEFVAAAG